MHAELFTAAGTAQWRDYLTVSGSMIGVRFSGATVQTRYFHKDHLGSIAVITDENGAVLERLSYDAWGKRRFPTGVDDPSGSFATSSQTSRGFTGEEMLGDVGLVHLNGRVYDPYVGRMMSADPLVPDPTDGQAWNRYSYVINNPLTFTDPSGYCFLGLCGLFNPISKFFNRIGNGIQKFLQKNPLVGAIIKIAGAILSSVACGPAAPICAAAAAAGLPRLHGVASIAGGVHLRRQRQSVQSHRDLPAAHLGVPYSASRSSARACCAAGSSRGMKS